MAAPYDSLEVILNTARVRLLDAVQSLAGEIVTDTAPFTLTMVNAAWRRLQEDLASRDFPAFVSETVLLNVAAWTINDPGVFAYFNWTQYWDGSVSHVSPVLPQDFIAPQKLWERQNGSNGIYVEMDEAPDGLPTANAGASAGTRDILNRLWEWRGQAIWLPGATSATDIRLRYSAFLPDFVASTTTAFSAQPVPIMRCLNSFAWYICSEAAKARGDADSGAFDEKAMAATDAIAPRKPAPPPIPDTSGGGQ